MILDLTSQLQFVNPNLKLVINTLEPLVKVATTCKRILISEYKFLATENVDFDSLKSLDDLKKYSIAIGDYLVMSALKHSNQKGLEFKFEKSDMLISDLYTVNNYLMAIAYCFFNLYTRNKLYCDGEERSLFTINLLKINLSEPSIKKLMSHNSNFEFISQDWIRMIKYDELSEEFRSRFSKGICGSRLFTCINNNPMEINIGEKERWFYTNLHILVEKFPLWEIHPMFRPIDKLKGLSINNILYSFIKRVYSTETILKMVEGKELFKAPPAMIRDDLFYPLTIEFFHAFKTKVFDDTPNI